ncbi:hypothetical protein KIPB_012925, partial [Kipferlia bialata]
LLEMSDIVSSVLSARPDVTVIALPAGAIRAFAKFLARAQETLVRASGKRDRTETAVQVLLGNPRALVRALVYSAIKALGLPICILNPPDTR